MNPKPWRRIAVVAILLTILAFAWTGRPDAIAQENVEVGLKRALVAFALARTANGVLSVVQETTIGASVLVAGVTTSPGQILDPLNDLIEQFSTLMLAACVSFGVQRILIEVGSYWPVAAALTVAAGAWALLAWRGARPPGWLTRIVLLLLLVRFAVPASVLVNEALFTRFMQAELAQSQQGLDQPPNIANWREPMKIVESLNTWAEDKVAQIIRVMTIFFVQTLLLPLVFIWLLQRALAALLQAPVRLSPRDSP